jgi:DNA repair exonuclease SbcCD nuclease subunit
MWKYAIATSDWHLSAKKPKFRRDNFLECQYEKVEFILRLCQEKGAALLNAGDIFDTARQPRHFVNRYLELFRKYHSVKHDACAGQHDQSFQSRNLSDTSFGTLLSSGVVTGQSAIRCDWGDPTVFEGTGVIVSHFCVTPKPVEFIHYSLTAQQFMDKAQARTAITGDYHVSHVYRTSDGRLLVNPGTITRNKADMVNFQPKVYLIDLEHNEVVEEIFIQIRPADEVFDLRAVELEQKQKEKRKDSQEIEDYIAVMREHGRVDPDFEGYLQQVIGAVEAEEEVKVEIDEIMGVANGSC